MQTISSKLDKLTQYMSAFQHEQRDLRTIDEENDQESERIGVSRKRSRSSGVLDQPQSLCPGFRGPTSSSFIFEVANDRLNKMGLRAEPNDHGAEASRGRPLPVYPNRQPRCAKPYSRDWGSDTLEQLGEETVVRLCEDYDASINVLYPVLDMPRILQRARLVFAQAGSSSDLGMEVGGSSNTTTDESKFEINIFKLMCAASLAFRGQADHAMAQVLYDDVDAETPVWDAMGIRGLQYLTLVIIYHVQMGQDVRASRIIGVAGRLCLEMGLNRREVLERTYLEQHARDLAVRIFWSIYLLDMRASCGTGIPFVIQDVDIDSTLPEPEPTTHIFLKTMISFARLSRKVWRVENSFTSLESKQTVDNIELLDFQALQWLKRLPESLKYDPNEPNVLSTSRREPLFARVVAHARVNQLRSLIYRRVLYSSSSISQHMLYAQTVVDIAKSTVALFTGLNRPGGIYHAHPVIFSHFVISALGVLLLAIANAPEHFSGQCCTEYYTALDLLKQSAMQSEVVSRLWKTVERLEGLGPVLGIMPPPEAHRPPQGMLLDTRPQPKSPAGGVMDDGNLAAPQTQPSDYRDDLASLFGFPLDAVDYGLFLSQDTDAAGGGNEAQLDGGYDDLAFDGVGGTASYSYLNSAAP